VTFRSPVVSPPPITQARRTERRSERRARPTAKKKTQTAVKQAVKRRPSVPQVTAAASSAVDSTLLVAGLALVVLVLGDAVFLALSTRFLRVS
jgi:asparagine synthetase B (glutamine-hydrolysing)